MTPRSRLFVFLAIAIATAVATVASARSDMPGKDRLVLGITQYPNTLHPSINAMLAKSYVLGFARRPITVHDKTWSIVCMMCVTLPTFENRLAAVETRSDGTKGIRVTFEIPSWARWGDGTPVTTADVVFTHRVGSHPESGISNFELYDRIEEIDVHDDLRFTMHIDRLTFDYNAINDFQLLPAHLERAAFANPAEYRNRTLYETDPTNAGLYNGPYRIATLRPGSLIVLERNPFWKGSAPGVFRQIVIRIIENTAALEANLRSGAVDYIPGELGLSVDQALAFERRFGRDYDINYKESLVYEHIDLNLDNPIFRDRRVRQALLLAIDRETINTTLFGGRQPVAHGFVNPLDWVASDALPRYDYDPVRASRLLDDAGWRLGPDGLRRNDAGEEFSFELMTGSGSRIREMVQQVLQYQWRQVGIKVRIRNLPPRVMFGEYTNQRKFTGGVMYAWFSPPENVPRTILHSSMIPTAENGWAGQNFVGFRNPEMDDLIDRTERELNREKRLILWARIQRIYAEEVPVLPLYFRSNPFIFPKWLRGIDPTGHQYPTSLWVEEWRIDDNVEPRAR